MSIAEEVFERLARERPNNPKVHYLLGYLRGSQGRYEEAIASFRRAVVLDPDYINAWKKLDDFFGRGLLAAEEQDDIALNLMRLDPLGRHTWRILFQVHNLSAAWKAIEEANAIRPRRVTALLPLTASAAMVDRKRDDAEMIEISDAMSNRSSPGRAIAEDSIISELVERYNTIDMSRPRH
jgi:tetratricopeptide (TPR) repeat protein